MGSDELRMLAEEQAALRRVATLVARGAAPEEVFAAAAEEVGHLLRVDAANMGRYEPDRTITILAAWGRTVDFFPVGSRWFLEDKNLTTRVFETGGPVRVDSYDAASGPVGVTIRETGFRSAVAMPIIVEGALWGVMVAGSTLEPPLPAGTEARLGSFTELLAIAIANDESRAGLARLAQEQVALRRVATLVARGAPPEELFAAVTNEAGRLLSVDVTSMGRYEPDDTFTVLASWGHGAEEQFPAGSRRSVGGKNLVTNVFETRRPSRIDNYADASGPIGVAGRKQGTSSAVATPIVVDGRLWGVMGAASISGPLSADTESRLGSFTELVATAIANAESRAALAASRARVVAAADDARRRIERDLHDRAQQRIVSLGLELRAAQATVPSQLAELVGKLSRVAEGLDGVFDELREISRGIHPAILSDGGLAPALKALARRSMVPVELHLRAEWRLPEHVEVAAYYVVSEALTNAAKHAEASVVNVELDTHDGIVQLTISDDGIGGAEPGRGSGLIGLSDRIEALGGTLQVSSPAGSGTTLLIEIPLRSEKDAGSLQP